MSAVVSIDDCELADPPLDGFFRVTDWHAPFEAPPPPAALGDEGEHADPSGRWDDPDGHFRTLYCASEAEGAIGEKLADFAVNREAAVRVEAFLDEEPDAEFIDEQLFRALDAEDVESFNWTLAWAPATPGAQFIDVNHWRTFLAARSAALLLLREFGLRAFDRGTLLDERRSVTRRLAGLWHAAAGSSGEPAFAGLRYTSRLPPAWVCWALWEPPALEAAHAHTEPVTITTPAFREAARKLGVILADQG